MLRTLVVYFRRSLIFCLIIRLSAAAVVGRAETVAEDEETTSKRIKAVEIKSLWTGVIAD